MRYYCKYFLFLVSLSLKEVESDNHGYRYDYKYSDVARGWFKTHIVPAIWADARLRCVMEGVPLTKLIIELKLKWAANKPRNDGNNENCIFMSNEGLIGDVSCNEVLPYICYRRGSRSTEHNECGTVDKEYRIDRRTNKCYKFHTVPRNFSRAFFVCTAEGGHIAIINSFAERDVLIELSDKYKHISVQAEYVKSYTFIGFHNWDEKFEWRTIHGKTLIDAGYNTWDDGEPNNKDPGEYCGAMRNKNGLLNDMACEYILQFICEKHPSSLTNCTNECNMKLRKGKRPSKENQKKERKRVSKLKSRNKYW